MTETRKWTLGAVAIVVLVMVAGWFLLIAPKRAEVADLNTQTQAQESQNSAAQTQLAVLKQENKDLPQKQAELAELQTKIPETAALPTYVREMQDIGRKSGVAFTSMTPTPPVPTGGVVLEGGALPPDQLAALNVDMVVTGSYFEITKFMNELETGSRYTLVSGFSIDSATSAEAGKKGELTGTVSARIYLVPATPEVVDSATAVTPTPAPSPTATP
ncbi:MAG: type 4a pilus biogenesis protein PilO [Actinomycetia bacterium]|nr:type 4a pilus biogenesis protein PilO [Actinomycetes bacterium]